MQRLPCLALLIAAACGGGTATGEATLSGVEPPVMAAASEPFSGADGAGNEVLGWSILLYADGPGGDCLEGNVVAKVGIYSNQAAGSGPHAILPEAGISIVAESPPTVVGTAAANMGVDGLSGVGGQITITEFHLTPDGITADRIAGSINAAGFDANQAGVSLTGDFTAPICQEE